MGAAEVAEFFARRTLALMAEVQTGASAGFQLRSLCGQTSEPFAAAPIKEQGRAPPGAMVGAVSTAGLKGRTTRNQDCLAAGLSPPEGGVWFGLVAGYVDDITCLILG